MNKPLSQTAGNNHHRLIELIELYGWKKVRLAEICGVSRQMVNAWTRVKDPAPVPDRHLHAIADHYSLDFRDMFVATLKGVELKYPKKMRDQRGKSRK